MNRAFPATLIDSVVAMSTAMAQESRPTAGVLQRNPCRYGAGEGWYGHQRIGADACGRERQQRPVPHDRRPADRSDWPDMRHPGALAARVSHIARPDRSIAARQSATTGLPVGIKLDSPAGSDLAPSAGVVIETLTGRTPSPATD